MDELKEEQKRLAKKIESGENKYTQLISDQDNLNAILDDKLAQKGVSTAYEYYLNMLLDN
jgi:5,10-methylenetetrahydrofolate reductase